ncbi:short-chain dehydrogenase [Litorimonas cladophorae]|uniref:Short-chain dehydrogenase n=1 Tax=Litorimonas cladophorae TaxID=1220491 RepID=A0A918NGN6_9PROT|nr:SDR family oxidoreductase [Litorimonas cladophorae]GGX71727.1 short-chain dehydrogenase [Litorimonas cladophorae]
MSKVKTALIIGAGDDTGSAIAKAFAREGLSVCVTRRPRHLDKLEQLVATIREEGGQAHAKPCDAREEAGMITLFEEVEAIGPLEVVVFNIGANVRFGITETSERVFRKVWEMACLSGFLTGREAARHMRPRGQGTIIFTGATASLRGASGFSAFSSAKHGLRAVAQSMARELGPQGLHVAHTVIDGMIDSNFIREVVPDVDDRRARDAILNPDHIAQAYVDIHNQPRTAWTFELDLRPYCETW